MTGAPDEAYSATCEQEELDRRAVCAASGHDPVRDDRGAPVTDFELCRRCGKILRSFHREALEAKPR